MSVRVGWGGVVRGEKVGVGGRGGGGMIKR